MKLPGLLKTAIRLTDKKHQLKSKLLYPYDEVRGDQKLYVLAQHGRGANAKKWLILGIIDNWGVKFNTYWNKTQFMVATTRTDFGGSANETFFQIVTRGSHIAKANGEIYSIRDGSTVQAFELNFAYHVLGDLEKQKTFAVADAEMEPEPPEPEPEEP